MSKFGWDLPPGCSHADIERAAGVEAPCDICGYDAYDCVCPECPQCGSQGDVRCYKEHGLRYEQRTWFALDALYTNHAVEEYAAPALLGPVRF